VRTLSERVSHFAMRLHVDVTRGPKMKNIYEATGGQAAVETAVDRFYERVTVDPVLAHFFVNLDLRKLKIHQIAFLGQAIGGPANYSGAGMQKAHAHLKIEQRHFDAVAGHLVGTLLDLAVPQELIEAIVGRIAPLAAQVVNTPSADSAMA
jgi:hemoglobin